TPPLEPTAYPERASCCGQLGTTSYGPGRSSPPFCWTPAAPHNRPHANTTATMSINLRMTFLLLLPVKDLYVLNRLVLRMEALLGSRQRLAVFRYDFGDGADLFPFKESAAFGCVRVDALEPNRLPGDGVAS